MPQVSQRSQPSGGSLRRLLLLSLPLLVCLEQRPAFGQVLDGDDQFQAYHQDIGRISGAQGAQVAPLSTIVRRAQTSSPAPGAQSPPVERPPLSPRTSQQRRPAPTRAEQPAVSRPAARLQASASGATQRAPALPAFVLAPPPAPQPQPQPQPASAHALPALPARPIALPSEEQLSQFRSAASSASARHSALMAQVAAERHQAATLAADSQPEVQPLALPSSQLEATPSARAASQLQDQLEEPVPAPSFEHVLSRGCPHRGVFSYPNRDHCDRYYMCTNGTFTEEACPNGLAYGQMGAVYQHCAYNWNVDCANKKSAGPIESAGCPWQFGIFPVAGAGKCSIDYAVCEWGVPETKRCQPEGLFYDDRIKGCQWADQLGCKSEKLLNFKCPPEDDENPYWPFPRYYHTKQDVVVCVNEQPRLVHCNEDQIVDPGSLACMDLHKNKKKKLVPMKF